MSKNFENTFVQAYEDIRLFRGEIALLKDVLSVEEIVSISCALNEIAATLEFAQARHEEHLRAVSSATKKRRSKSAASLPDDFVSDFDYDQEELPF